MLNIIILPYLPHWLGRLRFPCMGAYLSLGCRVEEQAASVRNLLEVEAALELHSQLDRDVEPLLLRVEHELHTRRAMKWLGILQEDSLWGNN